MRVLSLGWGWQSFTTVVMSALGDLEPVDVAIHADTDFERQATYSFAKRWTPWIEEHGIKVVTVSSNATIRVWHGEMIPAFTKSDDESGAIYGQALRTCTQRWKIAPMRRWLQDNRNGEQVELWIGISTDEALRMKPSGVKYINNRYPLIEKSMSRKDCGLYLVEHGIEIPKKSACTFCPFHSTKEWRDVKDNPKDWKEAIDVDRAIRDARTPYQLFLHPSRKPLSEVDLRTEQEKGQMSLWDEECEGMCGI
jgi:hypothetical protein